MPAIAWHAAGIAKPQPALLRPYLRTGGHRLMSFLAPYLLWGSLAAGIPLAIHFFFKSRFRTVNWAAMEFLLQAVEQTSRRIKFQELLLLLARITLLLLLAFAL